MKTFIFDNADDATDDTDNDDDDTDVGWELSVGFILPKYGLPPSQDIICMGASYEPPLSGGGTQTGIPPILE